MRNYLETGHGVNKAGLFPSCKSWVRVPLPAPDASRTIPAACEPRAAVAGRARRAEASSKESGWARRMALLMVVAAMVGSVGCADMHDLPLYECTGTVQINLGDHSPALAFYAPGEWATDGETVWHRGCTFAEGEACNEEWLLGEREWLSVEVDLGDEQVIAVARYWGGNVWFIADRDDCTGP
jgi:hypothetical protein